VASDEKVDKARSYFETLMKSLSQILASIEILDAKQLGKISKQTNEQNGHSNENIYSKNRKR
jgi:hypothetical protein